MNTALARKLRKNMPPAEARMWNLLREEPFTVWHFRRQVPITGYFADFGSHAARLVVEIDGDTHGTDGARRRDAVREAALRREGYQTLRFTNRDVMNNLEGVGTIIIDALAAHPHPTPSGPPSPQGGGRK